MTKQYRQATAYVDEATYLAFAAVARRHRRSMSGHLKALIEQELAGQPERQKEIRDTALKILIGVDALLKHHPNDSLFGVVKATRNMKLGGASDDA